MYLHNNLRLNDDYEIFTMLCTYLCSFVETSVFENPNS